MPVILFMLAIPYIVRRALERQTGMTLGFIPKGALAMAKKHGPTAAKMAMGPQPGAAQPGAAQPSGMPSPMAMAALGPAAMLTTPQGKALVAKGIKTAAKARKGDPKARKKIAQTRARAKAGDPKAKREMAALEAGEMLREEMDEDSEMDEEESDEE